MQIASRYHEIDVKRKSLLSLFLLFLLQLTNFNSSSAQIAMTLAQCPDSPNCVCTLEKRKSKRMEPLRFDKSPEDAIKKLEELLATYPKVTLVKKEGNHLHYAFETSIGNFIDDVEFLIDPENKIIHFRSASRVGYGDLGKNRRRMRKFARKWNKPQKLVTG